MKRPNWKRAVKLLRDTGEIHRACVECGKRIPEGAGYEWGTAAWTCEGACTDALREQTEIAEESRSADRDFYASQAYDDGYEKGYLEAEQEYREW